MSARPRSQRHATEQHSRQRERRPRRGIVQQFGKGIGVAPGTAALGTCGVGRIGRRALLAAALALTPELAYAQSAAPVEGILDWFVGVLQGNVARSLAIIAVCFLGFLFLTGRMAWQGAISIVIGIAIIFGAAELVDAMKSSAGL